MATPSSADLPAILGRIQNRREFLRMFGRGLGYGALVSALPACGGSDSDDGDGDPPPPTPPIPRPSAEYSVLKRTSFGLHRDELRSIQTLGIDNYLAAQMDHSNINDGSLEADIQALFPLTLQTPEQLISGFPDNIFDIATQMIAATQYRQMFSKRQHIGIDAQASRCFRPAVALISYQAHCIQFEFFRIFLSRCHLSLPQLSFIIS